MGLVYPFWFRLVRVRAKSQQLQLLAISGQVNELKSINETLKTYLEAVMKGVTADETTEIIKSEEKRLEEAKILEKLSNNSLCKFLLMRLGCSIEKLVEAISSANSFSDFSNILSRIQNSSDEFEGSSPIILGRFLTTNEQAQSDFNEARKILGLNPITAHGFST